MDIHSKFKTTYVCCEELSLCSRSRNTLILADSSWWGGWYGCRGRGALVVLLSPLFIRLSRYTYSEPT